MASPATVETQTINPDSTLGRQIAARNVCKKTDGPCNCGKCIIANIADLKTNYVDPFSEEIVNYPF